MLLISCANSVSRRKVSDLPKGVSFQRGGSTFTARVMKEGKRYCLGTFKTVEEAHKAFKIKHRELFKEFSAYN